MTPTSRKAKPDSEPTFDNKPAIHEQDLQQSNFKFKPIKIESQEPSERYKKYVSTDEISLDENDTTDFLHLKTNNNIAAKKPPLMRIKDTRIQSA